MVDNVELPSFKEAWAKKEAAGYRYGGNALENVAFGYEIARQELKALSRPPAEQVRMREAFRAWCEIKGLLAKPDRHSLNKQERDLYDALTAALTPPPERSE